MLIKRSVLALFFVLTAGCSLPTVMPPPHAGSVPTGPMVDGPASPQSVSVAVSIRMGDKFLDVGYQEPAIVYFTRVSGLNGNHCQPREKRFKEGFDVVSTAGGMADTLRSIGGDASGQGSFGAGGDPTCLFDEYGSPVWEPVLYPSSYTKGNVAYLINVPPGRYAAVAAVYPYREFGTNEGSAFQRAQEGGITLDLSGGRGRSDSAVVNAVVDEKDRGTITVFLTEQAVFGSEVAAPPGAAVYMGNVVMKRVVFGRKYDAVQQMFRAQIEAMGPSRMEQFVASMIRLVAGGHDSSGPQKQESSRFVRVDHEGWPLDYFITGLPYHLGTSPWVERFRTSSMGRVEEKLTSVQ